MPPRRKSLQTLFVETILFVSLIALVGHLSINFWERYMVQNELSKMKNSLYTLKDTINHIGIAYTQLYKELQFLADIAEGGDLKYKTKHENYESKEHHTDLAQELLQDIQIQAMIDNGIKVNDPQKIKTEKTQTAKNKDTQMVPNTTTLDKFAAVPKNNKMDKQEKQDKSVGYTGYRNKKIQHIHNLRTLPSKFNKDAGTATKNPERSKSAGTDDIVELDSRKHIDEKSSIRNNIHRCHDNNYCTAKDDSEFDFSKF